MVIDQISGHSLAQSSWHMKLTSTDTVRQVKRQFKKWKKIFANHISDKSLTISKIHKQLFNPKLKTNPILKWAKDLNRHFSIKDLQITDKHISRYSVSLVFKEMQLKPNERPLHTHFSSVQLLIRVWLWPHEPQHTRPPCLSPTPGVYSNSCPLSRWCHPTISSSVVPFSSRPQSFPTSGSFQMSQLFTSDGQSTGVSALTSVLPINTQDWSPLRWTSLISLQSKGPSRVFSNTTVQKHQFFGAQLSL